jgi:hypothetical protein
MGGNGAEEGMTSSSEIYTVRASVIVSQLNGRMNAHELVPDPGLAAHS